MHKYILIISILLTNIVNSQNGCGTEDIPLSEWRQKMEAAGILPKFDGTDIRPRATIYVPMHYHIVRNNDGSGGFPLNYLMDLHCDLNNNYSGSGVDIKFILDTISYINSTTYYNITFQSQYALDNANTLNHCNVYLVNDPAGNCGFTQRPTNGNPSRRSSIFVKASFNSVSCSEPGSTTLTHEMGHWLDLPHTFFGWESMTYGTTNSPSNNTRERVVRTGNTANCRYTGDGFCDTDPDYISDRWQCPNNTVYKDPLNASFTHNGTYFMSYSNDACQTTFTSEQATQMYSAMNNMTDRKDLLTLPVPIDGVLGAFTDYYPHTTGSNEFLIKQNLKLIFNKQENATGYNVTLAYGTSSLNNFFNFPPSSLLIDTFITDTFFNINPSLLNSTNTFYYWKVRAINKLHSCGLNVIDKQAFKVADLDMSTKTISPLCKGEATGSIEIVNNTNNSNYSFKINGDPIGGNFKEYLASGNYVVEATLNNNKYYFNATIGEGVEVKSKSVVISNNKVTITPDGGKSPYTYLWSNGDQGSPITLAKGNYTVTIVDDNNCSSKPIEVKITESTSSILSNTATKTIVYPTSIKQNEVLTIDNLNSNKLYEVKIIDVLGKIVKNDSYTSLNGKIEMTWKEKSGLYFLHINADNKSEVYRVLSE